MLKVPPVMFIIYLEHPTYACKVQQEIVSINNLRKVTKSNKTIKGAGAYMPCIPMAYTPLLLWQPQIQETIKKGNKNQNRNTIVRANEQETWENIFYCFCKVFSFAIWNFERNLNPAGFVIDEEKAINVYSFIPFNRFRTFTASYFPSISISLTSLHFSFLSNDF